MVLQNEFLKVEISSLGAELKSILTVSDKEILWQADANYWGKTSPVLFPIVGGLKHDFFMFDQKKFTLNRHGFAREMLFEERKINDEEVVFTLKSNGFTQVFFPFEFVFKIKYTLNQNKVSCKYIVENSSLNNNLLFSVGGHPAFDLIGGMSNYELIFNKDAVLNCSLLKEGLVDSELKKLVLDEGVLPLNYDLFYSDALVFKSLKSNEIILRNKNDLSQVRFQFNNFPYFGIWSAKNADFVCLEPWCGIADAVNHNNELIEKEGMNLLKPQEVFERSWGLVIE